MSSMKLKHVVIGQGKSQDVKALRIEATEMVEGKWHVLLTDAPNVTERTPALGFNLDTNEDE